MFFSIRFKKENFDFFLKRFKKNIEKQNKICKKEKKKILNKIKK
ncbi:hypothetical protein [Candidatus Carsonella ruddii]|nr:hypothetical protein [Candidatus Carsonella ruddii]